MTTGPDATFDMAGYFEPFYRLAEEVMSDETPAPATMMDDSPADLARRVTAQTGAAPDLLAPWDFEAAYASDDAAEVEALRNVAFLRWRVFHLGTRRGIGFAEANDRVVAHAEYWFDRLDDRLRALQSGEPVRHDWLN